MSNATLAEAVPKTLEQTLRDLLRQRLESSGAYDVVVYPDADYEGDPILVVEVKHQLVDRPVDPREVIEAEKAARDIAWQEGERRFVYFRHVFDERQRVVGTR
jgi:hypothetical protein